MGEMTNAYNILGGKPRGKRPLGHLRIDGKIILEWKETGSEVVAVRLTTVQVTELSL